MVGTTPKTNIKAEHRAAAPFNPIDSNMLGNQNGPIYVVENASDD
jgi:hypothetical protein